jgi:hypothetical protein
MASPTSRLDVQNQADVRPIRSSDFQQRAREYRLAALFTNSHREAQTFRDLALLFDKIGRDFRSWEETNNRVRPGATDRSRMH